MLFAVSGLEINPMLPVAAGAAISFFCSMTGISGAFLLLPLQFGVLGYTVPGVSATNQIFNIMACPGGIWKYAREKRLLLPLTLLLVLGTLPGTFIGAWIRIYYLADPRHFKIFCSLMLLYLGLRLIRSASTKNKTDTRLAPNISASHAHGRMFFQYGEEQLELEVWPVLLLAFVVGIAGGIYGVGGGAMIVPVLVSFFRLPIHMLAGASLCSTFITSVAGVVFYTFFAVACNLPTSMPDWALGACFGIGGLAGMYAGASMQKYVSGKLLRGLLAVIVLSTAAIYACQAIFD